MQTRHLALGPGADWLSSTRAFDRRVEDAMAALRNRRGIGPAAWLASRGGDLLPVLVLVWSAVRTRRAAVPAITAVAAQSIVVNYGVKRLARRQRPSGGGHTSSFPSGHTATAAAVAVLAGPAPLVLGSSAVLTGAGRVVRGVHWASDVLVGGAIGLAYGLLLRRILGRIR